MSIVQCYKTTAPIQGVLTLITEQSFLDKRIRVFGTPEDPLFLARDVAEWIDYSKRPDGSYKMDVFLRTVESEEKFKYLVPAHNLGGVLQANTEYWFLTEDGLYEVLMQSRKPKAKEFKKEVKKILKSIRKTGRYVVGQNVGGNI
ncbi:Bro-N domain-containing protein [Blautia massiliensis (ex Durand et al. 2017)]|uniref:BRO-N domain-containing protein n=1 Tax=Blautia massiliensis (ex Durand et al. 2017) TaxID=1737424 RepID=UPI002ED3B291